MLGWGGVGGARGTSFPLGAPVRPVLPQLQEELEQPGPRPGPLSRELVRGWDSVGRGSHHPGIAPMARKDPDKWREKRIRSHWG